MGLKDESTHTGFQRRMMVRHKQNNGMDWLCRVFGWMASFLLGKKGGCSKSLLPSSRWEEYAWVLLLHRVIRGDVGRRDVTSTWTPVIETEGTPSPKV
ncbi:hypothetical protein TNCT_50121 [Trichonephila clavata]|uniref:Uncharacterized protein n=1 Tax=Trichonephila clavata TaxID=2740835 RepID=A0A8X6FLN5_TRICU|nr:hypothetical protein TNCT_50121 [Trichonephila clavata]